MSDHENEEGDFIITKVTTVKSNNNSSDQKKVSFSTLTNSLAIFQNLNCN